MNGILLPILAAATVLFGLGLVVALIAWSRARAQAGSLATLLAVAEERAPRRERLRSAS